MYNPNYSPVPPRNYNGTLILILGICGLMVCALCAPFAWSMGTTSLGQMDADGVYDGNERTLVSVGRILGIVGSLFIILGIVAFVLFGLLGVLAHGHR